jgi:hypothetical protein
MEEDLGEVNFPLAQKSYQNFCAIMENENAALELENREGFYPFGMRLAGLSTNSGNKNKYIFNGDKEKLSPSVPEKSTASTQTGTTTTAATTPAATTQTGNGIGGNNPTNSESPSNNTQSNSLGEEILETFNVPWLSEEACANITLGYAISAITFYKIPFVGTTFIVCAGGLGYVYFLPQIKEWKKKLNQANGSFGVKQ